MPGMELSQWLEQERGRQNRLARHLGLRPPVVAAWVSGRRPVPMPHGAAIEQFTGGAVSRKDLFPDDWSRLWPELAAPTDTQADPQPTTQETQHA